MGRYFKAGSARGGDAAIAVYADPECTDEIGTATRDGLKPDGRRLYNLEVPWVSPVSRWCPEGEEFMREPDC